jgi:glycosyltransferase involved in cell wall biosynthesis
MTHSDIFLSVVAPAYNEEASIEAVIREWEEVLKKYDYTSEIVICNDGSTDRTGAILDGLMKEFPNLRAVHSPKNGGYGDALFNAIYASRGEYVVTIDSDGQFELSDVELLLKECVEKKLDAVTGYRTRKKDTYMRFFADRVLNIMVKALFGLGFRDTNCALKLFKGGMIRGTLNEARFYPTPTEILIRLHEQKARISEVGVRHNRRIGGQSHLRFVRTSIDMLLFLLYMRFRLHLERSRVINVS